jgi:hypothetical protein
LFPPAHSRRYSLFALDFKPDHESYGHRGGSFRKERARRLGTEAHAYNSNPVVAGLPDTCTEHKPVTDDESKELDAVFHLSETLE